MELDYESREGMVLDEVDRWGRGLHEVVLQYLDAIE